MYFARCGGHEAQLSGCEVTRREMPTQRKKRCTCAKGICVLAGWAARMGKWRVDSCSCREFRLEEKAKAKIGRAKAGLFNSPGHRAFITHTHKHVEFITKQQIRHHHLRQYLLARLIHCCWICCISGRRNGRRFCLSCLEVDVCARGGDRRSCSVRSCLTRSSSQTGRLGRFDAFL
jgi:hypothetical protein